MKKFLEDLKKELSKYAIDADEVNEIVDDHEEMIREAITDGLNPESVEEKFGSPKKLAKELAETATKEEVHTNPKGYISMNTFSEEIKEVNVSIISDDIVCELSSNSNTEVLFKNIENPEEYVVTCENGKLFVSVENKKSGFFWNTKRKSGEILVKVKPEQKIKTVQVETVSGDMKINNISAKKMSLNSTSGDVVVNNSNHDELELKTVSGDSNVNNLNSYESRISAVSGDSEIHKFNVDNNLDFNTVSGDLVITNSTAKEFYFKSVSGDCEAKELYTEAISMITVSGDVLVDNKDKSKVMKVLRKRTVSGDLKIK